ncbi:MAG: hypothetical protein ACM31E_11540, partial [Fibrobacterota bacterium]
GARILRIDNNRNTMKMIKFAALTGILIFLISCSPFRRYVRTSPEFQTLRENIDTIAVISDALVAIDDRNDYYSVNSSYALDSLILYGVTKSLSKKGYTTIPIEPCFMGSFMDTILTVPVKPLNENSIQPNVLPYNITCKLSSSQQDAMRRISRKLYLNLVYSDPSKQNTLNLTEQTRIDLDTISGFTNSQYAFFVFHQAGLVDPALTAGMAVGTLALTTLLSGGMIIGYVTKVSVFHTYLILLDLSTGKVIWSNYLPYDAAPTTPILKMSKNYEDPITRYIKADTLSKRVLYRWHNNSLSAFPIHSETGFFSGYKKRRPYPAQNFFTNVSTTNYSNLSNLKLKRRIDSLITALSLSENVVNWVDDDTTDYVIGKGRSVSSISQEFSVLDNYLKYAYNCRMKFNPALQGSLNLSFIITANGNFKRIKVIETSIDDVVMNYAIPKILKMVKLSAVSEKTGVSEATHEVRFGKK